MLRVNRSIEVAIAVVLVMLSLNGCKEKGNRLSESNSIYLLEHADNPINWHTWGDYALDIATKNNKLIVVSIGYSACHWCHVMEAECFENEAVAEYMNRHFVSIKVDREERPDVDQIYLRALQIMTGKAGWPLNVVCLPDGRPIYGATYLPKDQWLSSLEKLQNLFEKEPEKLKRLAEEISNGVVQSQILEYEESEKLSQEGLDSAFAVWEQYWDYTWGGELGEPKFPMPVRLNSILNRAMVKKDSNSLEYIQHSLNSMANGGIYDQLVGGFSRYSVDSTWHLPHFEKMLYDNAQLMRLYAKAARVFHDKSFLRIAEEIANFCQVELKSQTEGAYYSSLNADTEGKEGGYYLWTETELKDLIKNEEWKLFKDYFSLERPEKDGFVLKRYKGSNEEFALENGLEREELESLVQSWQSALIAKRNERVKPRVDDKLLCSWNALMISGYAELFRATGKESYRTEAMAIAEWIKSLETDKDHSLRHSSRLGKKEDLVFIEDYAFAISAFIDLFLISSEEDYLYQAEKWILKTEEDFLVKDGQFFSTNSSKTKGLITESIEVLDQVIPSSNATMALNYFQLAHLLENPEYREKYEAMLKIIKSQALSYPTEHAQWLNLGLKQSYEHYEVVISGPEAEALMLKMQQYSPPNALVCWAANSDLSLFDYRDHKEETFIYVCQFGFCKEPVRTVEEAIEQMNQDKDQSIKATGQRIQ